MNDSKKLYRIAENLSSDLYSYQDGETDINVIYNTLENVVYNIRVFRETVTNDQDRLWSLFCALCHFDHVYQGALNQYKDSLMSLIIK